MRYATQASSWAVYRIAAQGKEPATNAMCDQGDWAEIERLSAGRCVLIRSHVTNEGEAERLARGTSGDAKPRVRHPWLSGKPAKPARAG
jgi:hypothetical protein